MQFNSSRAPSPTKKKIRRVESRCYCEETGDVSPITLSARPRHWFLVYTERSRPPLPMGTLLALVVVLSLNRQISTGQVSPTSSDREPFATPPLFLCRAVTTGSGHIVCVDVDTHPIPLAPPPASGRPRTGHRRHPVPGPHASHIPFSPTRSRLVSGQTLAQQLLC